MQRTGKDREDFGMFKAYDIRTREENLSDAVLARLCRAVAAYADRVLGVDSVVMGRDARLAAPRVMQCLLDTFLEAGIDAYCTPLQISTCQFYWACMQNPSAAGIMVTASHNPGEYIGLKVMAPGLVTLASGNGPEGGITKIREFYLDGTEPRRRGVRGRLRERSWLEGYIEYTMRLANVREGSLKGEKILTEFLSGAAGTEIYLALARAGAEVESRHIIPDGRFPSGDPNPSIESSIAPAREAMKKSGCDIGFAYDGDGDRMDILLPDGSQLAPAFNLDVLVPEIVEIFRPVWKAGLFEGSSYRPQIYCDVKANPLSMRDQARRGGVGVHIIRNGHSFIKEKLRENFPRQYLVASEESAHYYSSFPYDLTDFSKGFAAVENTLFFTLLTARLWKEKPEAYREAAAQQSTLARVREWPCHFRDPAKMPGVMQEVEDHFRSRGLTVIKTMDDGSPLDAVLLRSGIPETIGADTPMEGPWFQIAERISRSEEGMARWEIVGNDKALVEQSNAEVREITDRHVKAGEAAYGG